MIWQNEFTLGIWIVTGLILFLGAKTGPEKADLKSFNTNWQFDKMWAKDLLKKWTEYLTQSHFFKIYNLGKAFGFL